MSPYAKVEREDGSVAAICQVRTATNPAGEWWAVTEAEHEGWRAQVRMAYEGPDAVAARAAYETAKNRCW